jgi:hypothetical protein
VFATGSRRYPRARGNDLLHRRDHLTASSSETSTWGINTLFLLDAGLTIFEVFVANAAFTAAMALFEVVATCNELNPE